jgi:hypothetical protein
MALTLTKAISDTGNLRIKFVDRFHGLCTILHERLYGLELNGAKSLFLRLLDRGGDAFGPLDVLRRYLHHLRGSM